MTHACGMHGNAAQHVCACALGAVLFHVSFSAAVTLLYTMTTTQCSRSTQYNVTAPNEHRYCMHFCNDAQDMVPA